MVSEGLGRRARGPAVSSSSCPRRRTEEGKEAARPCPPRSRGRLLCEPPPFPTRESGRREECVAALPAEPTAGWRAAPPHGTVRCRSAAEDAPGGASGCLGGHRLRRAAGTVPAAGREGGRRGGKEGGGAGARPSQHPGVRAGPRSADRGVREAGKRLEASRAGGAEAGRAAWLSVLRVRVESGGCARLGAAAGGPAGYGWGCGARTCRPGASLRCLQPVLAACTGVPSALLRRYGALTALVL